MRYLSTCCSVCASLPAAVYALLCSLFTCCYACDAVHAPPYLLLGQCNLTEHSVSLSTVSHFAMCEPAGMQVTFKSRAQEADPNLHVPWEPTSALTNETSHCDCNGACDTFRCACMQAGNSHTYQCQLQPHTNISCYHIQMSAATAHKIQLQSYRLSRSRCRPSLPHQHLQMH